MKTNIRLQINAETGTGAINADDEITNYENKLNTNGSFFLKYDLTHIAKRSKITCMSSTCDMCAKHVIVLYRNEL